MTLDDLTPTNENLIPDTINPTPDYYCTWQTQLYATCDAKPCGQRAALCEKSLFDRVKPRGWAFFYEAARSDLIFVMDDSWDVPPNDDGGYFGNLVLDAQKFPDATKGAQSNTEALRNLRKKLNALGWKGLGGWVCAQEAPLFFDEKTQTPEAYWTKRCREAAEAGFTYWKVDWGRQGDNADFREMLTAIGKKVAPSLVIEHSRVDEIVLRSDVYRTYDVPAVMSIPMTLERVRHYCSMGKTAPGRCGLVNCEDEAYIAAAGGFAMGIMRHPFVGALPDGRADMSFPAVHRNLKSKMLEVVRAARWHRIAPAFSVNCDEFTADPKLLTDSWRFGEISEEIEAWWLGNQFVKPCMTGNILSMRATARLARRTSLPNVTPDASGMTPYVIASENPSGAFSIATIGRTADRKYFIPKCDVSVNAGDSRLIGIFGEYASLRIKTTNKLAGVKILAQDLADETAYDITTTTQIHNDSGEIIIPGKIIKGICTLRQPPWDTSEPGLVIKLT